MNVFQVVVTAVLTTLTVFALVVAGAWALWPKTAQASASVAAHASSWHSAEDGHCGRFDSAHIELGEAVLATALDLTDTQQASLAPVTQAAQRWRNIAQSTCENINLETLDTSMESLENILAQSTQAVQEMRPLINQFYASLDTNQQEKLKQFMHSHHRSGNRHGRRAWH